MSSADRDAVVMDAAMSGDYTVGDPDERSLLRSNLDASEKDIEPVGGPVDDTSDEGEPAPPVLRPAIHEMGIHLLFAEETYGLTPYYAVVREWEPDLDETVAPFPVEFPAETELWEITQGSYWNGSILADGESYDTYNEYTIQVRAVEDDGPGERKISFQFRPALPNACRRKNGERTRIGSLPAELPYGLRVQCHCANVERDEVLPILRGLFRALGIKPAYVSDEYVHEWSRLYQLALYVRVRRDLGEERIIPIDGLLDRLAEFGYSLEEIVGHRTAYIIVYRTQLTKSR